MTMPGGGYDDGVVVAPPDEKAPLEEGWDVMTLMAQ